MQGKGLVITTAQILLPLKFVSRGGSASPAKDFHLKNSRVTTKFGLSLALYRIGGARLLYAKSAKAKMSLTCLPPQTGSS